ncbi:hypothetical protein D3C86_2076940 [compost metagenome]
MPRVGSEISENSPLANKSSKLSFIRSGSLSLFEAAKLSMNSSIVNPLDGSYPFLAANSSFSKYELV